MHDINKGSRKDIKIFCIDVNKIESQNQREKEIAENIMKILDNKKTFVILGNVHASKEKMSIHGHDIIPSGFFLFEKLGDKMFSINLLPRKGKYYNMEIKEIHYNNFYKASENPLNKGYDYILEIEEVSPCSFLE